MTFAYRINGKRADYLHNSGMTWAQVGKTMATEVGRPAAYNPEAVARAAKDWRERQLWSEANRMAAWLRRVKATWASQRTDLLRRMRAGETRIQVIIREPISAADIDISKPVAKTSTHEVAVFHYHEEDGRWEITVDDWWSLIDDGVLGPPERLVTRRGPIADQVNALRDGEELRISGRDLDMEWPRGPFDSSTTIDRFLSSCIGSAYGTVRAEPDILHPEIIIISRHKPDDTATHSGFLHHVDVDRQHLFDKVAGGWKRRPPAPPFPIGSSTNCKRAGWEAYFAGRGRDDCPFPIGRGDLQDGYREGWDAAGAWANAHE